MGLIAEYRTGLLQRSDILPKGKYWIDVFSPKQAVWDNWIHSVGGDVTVLTTESYAANGGYDSRNWYLFQVNNPVLWQPVAPQLGYPTVASKDVTSSEDTANTPTVEEGIPEKYNWIKWAVGGVIAVGGIYAVAKLVRG